MSHTPFRIGLLGAHNSGKTVLAEKLAEALSVRCIKTTTSAVFAARGIDPASTLDFETRLSVQNDVLDTATALWSATGEGGSVSDRTSLDMAAYLLCDVQNETRASGREVREYVRRCYEVTGSCFDCIVLVSPGIKVTARPGKAAPNEAYIEHLHYTMLGLLADVEGIRSTVMPRACLELPTRVQFVLDFLGA